MVSLFPDHSAWLTTDTLYLLICIPALWLWSLSCGQRLSSLSRSCLQSLLDVIFTHCIYTHGIIIRLNLCQHRLKPFRCIMTIPAGTDMDLITYLQDKCKPVQSLNCCYVHVILIRVGISLEGPDTIALFHISSQ